MANALNVNLEKGQTIELNDGRIVKAHGGFGMVSFTSGQALIVDLPDGSTERVSGYDLKRVVKD